MEIGIDSLRTPLTPPPPLHMRLENVCVCVVVFSLLWSFLCSIICFFLFVCTVPIFLVCFVLKPWSRLLFYYYYFYTHKHTTRHKNHCKRKKRIFTLLCCQKNDQLITFPLLQRYSFPGAHHHHYANKWLESTQKTSQYASNGRFFGCPPPPPQTHSLFLCLFFPYYLLMPPLTNYLPRKCESELAPNFSPHTCSPNLSPLFDAEFPGI